MEFLKDGRLPFVEFILAFHHIFNQWNPEQQNNILVFSFPNQNQSLNFLYSCTKNEYITKTHFYEDEINKSLIDFINSLY